MRSCPQCSAECATDHRFCPACGFPIGALRTAAGDPLIGRTLGGAYVILENVGSGGMGRVYRAEQISLGKTLAVKVIHPHLISDESATSRFYTEARASSRLNHPNSVSVLDFGRTDDGLLYLVMEFLRGKDLAHVLWEQGPLSASRAVGILRQMLAALSEAHDLGIIHRDIKPENILIEPLRTGGDFVKVVDFGLAKVRADVAPSVTMPGIVCGTPDYMAPEQGRGDPLDPRSDLYSCGVLLFQTLTGRLPYEAESPTQIVLMHMTEPIPDPRTFLPSIPDLIAECTVKALSKDADDRYQGAVEFAEALQEALLQTEANHAGRHSRSATTPAPAPTETQTCLQCGASVAVGLKFCGECGARMIPVTAPQPIAAVGASDSSSPGPNGAGPTPAITQAEPRFLTFVGRDLELQMLANARTKVSKGSLVSVRVQGDAGWGKRRLVRAFADTARSNGDFVIVVGPDPSWAGAAYSPIARCVREALGIAPGENALAWLDVAASSREGGVDRAVRAGFEELFTDAGPRHLDGRARREAVVRALSFAIVHAASHATTGAAVIVMEQLHRTDTATLAALTTLTSQSINAPVLLIGTHTSRSDPHWLHSELIVLHGLKRDEAGIAISGVITTQGPDVTAALDNAGDDIPPLYVDQVARWSLEGGGPAPARVVDLVSARFERLPPRARRAVQVLSLLGEADAVLLTKVIGDEFDSVTSTALRMQGWLELVADSETPRYRLAHALVREVAEASIPSVARSELHEKCAEVLVDEPVPMEARALHASYAEDPFQALILLERVGDRAIARGDDLGAAHALRRGLERARRELMRGELDEPERAMAIFARKLGDALIRAGEAAEAEGVLREGLELLSRSSVDWARLQGSLARALYARGRTPDALRAMDEAVKSARRLGARLAAVELIMARADLEGSLGNIVESVAQLRTAEELLLELLSEASSPARRPASGSSPPAGDEQAQRLRIEVLVRLSRGLRQVGEEMAAGEPLLEARELADKLGLVLERARCDAEGAERAEQLGDFRAAAHAWRRATTGARDAGDVVAEAQYHERASRLPRVIAQSAG